MPRPPKQDTEHTSNIRVTTRLRPFNAREDGDRCVVECAGNEVMVEAPEGKVNFAFDSCFYSDPADPMAGSQQVVYQGIGDPVLQAALQGYNACLFAYGQTGSGKSHSILGLGQDPGLIPRLSIGLFDTVQKWKQDGQGEIRVWVSFLEIYNEKIRDLLFADAMLHDDMHITEHPTLGVFIADLTESVAQSLDDVQALIEFGTKKRAVSQTNMNASSSRSHAIFVVKIQKHFSSGKSTLTARINLVDLAGSERSGKAQTTGQRFKEGCAINQSLSALARCIRALEKNEPFLPFRASKLTHFLKESLAGNSKTSMLATLSPAADNVAETLSTLRFAASVKQVVTKAKVNEDKTADNVKALKAEIAALKTKLAKQSPEKAADLNADLDVKVKMVNKASVSYAAQVAESQNDMEKRDAALDELGLAPPDFSVFHDENTPYLMNISDDPMLTGLLMYFLPCDEDTLIGTDVSCSVRLKGLGLTRKMAIIKNRGNQDVVIRQTLEPPLPGQPPVRLLLNGHRLDGNVLVGHLDRLVFGRAIALRVVVPTQAGGPDTEERIQVAQMDLTACLAEVAPEESFAYSELKYYLDSLASRIPEDKMKGLVATLSKFCPLVDEANHISDDVRPTEGFKFEVEVIWDLYHFDPSQFLVIRLVKVGEAAEPDQPPPSTVLYYWSLEKFQRRLEQMRDVFHHHHEAQEKALSSRGQQREVETVLGHWLLDPWHEPSSMEVLHALHDAEHTAVPVPAPSTAASASAVTAAKAASSRSKGDAVAKKVAATLASKARARSPGRTKSDSKGDKESGKTGKDSYREPDPEASAAEAAGSETATEDKGSAQGSKQSKQPDDRTAATTLAAAAEEIAGLTSKLGNLVESEQARSKLSEENQALKAQLESLTAQLEERNQTLQSMHRLVAKLCSKPASSAAESESPPVPAAAMDSFMPPTRSSSMATTCVRLQTDPGAFMGYAASSTDGSPMHATMSIRSSSPVPPGNGPQLLIQGKARSSPGRNPLDAFRSATHTAVATRRMTSPHRSPSPPPSLTFAVAPMTYHRNPA